jgi:hypothetical protein
MDERRIKVELINNGTEIRVRANRAGFRYLAEICGGLAEAEYDDRRTPHWHVDPALNNTEPDSVPMELCLTVAL